MTERRVALVASSYAPFVGGVEQHVAHVAGELLARGYEVEVWTVARDGVAAVRNVDGVTVRDLPAPLPARNPRSAVTFATSTPRAWWYWWRAWRHLHPQILHVQCFGPNGLYATALSALTRTPLVVSSHGETDADDSDIFRTSFLMPAGLRRAVAAATAVTGCSTSVKDDLETRFGARDVQIVPNGVTALRVAAVESYGRRVIGVGRLEYNKGFDLLLQAVAKVPNTELMLVGDGRQRRALEAQSRELGIADRVHFVGSRSVAEARAAIANAAVVVVPSRKESFGIVALEAWSAGTPLVSTSTCGPAHFVTNGKDGLLVDPSDAVALASTIARVLDDEALASSLAVEGRRSVRTYTWAKVVDRYEELYARSLQPS